jgi:hypothetical protein
MISALHQAPDAPSLRFAVSVLPVRLRSRALGIAAIVAIGVLGLVPRGVAAAVCDPLSGDIDGDGYADLVAGEPSRIGDSDLLDLVGAIHVLPGEATGLKVAPDDQVIDQGDVADDPVPAAGFGTAVAVGDFDGDCFADVAASAPREGSGAISVMPGSAAGVVPFDGHIWSIPEVGPPLVDEDNGFGTAMATGDLNGDGYADLVIGAPQVDGNRGAIGVLYGSPDGLKRSTDHGWFDQDTPGVPGVNEAGDRFGLTLAVGDFDGDAYDDLAVGVQHERVGSLADAGSVTILPGSPDGVTSTGAELWTQDSPGVYGAVENGDQFGGALAAGDLTGDHTDDLAIASPYETIRGVTWAGSVTVLNGSGAGLVGSAVVSQDSPYIPGTNETSDKFGLALAIGDVDRDGDGDLIVGTPFENVGSLTDAGTVTVIPGASHELDASRSKVFSQDTAGVSGTAEKFDLFGFALTAGRFTGSAWDDLIVGAPGESSAGKTNNGLVTLLHGGSLGATGTGSQGISGASLTGGPKSHSGLGTSLD